jgi:methylmalonyl-CoA mutase cobalamin-binding subunit
VVVVAGGSTTSERPVLALVESLDKLGVEATYLGREERPDRIAASVVEHRADSVELCWLGGRGLVLLLRVLLRELVRADRSQACVVVHRIG